MKTKSGKVDLQERIAFSVDWNKVPKGEKIVGEIVLVSDYKTETIYVPVFNPIYPSVNDLKGLYVEDNGCVSINAGKFHRKIENSGIKITSVKGLGYENDCVPGWVKLHSLFLICGLLIEVQELNMIFLYI